MIGFSLLGAVTGLFCAFFGSVLGSLYQLLKVLTLFFKVACRCESRIADKHQPGASQMLDISDASFTSDRRNPGMQFVMTGPRRMFCCIRLPNTCPECFALAYKPDSDNKMNCLVCRAVWCWTCRQRIDGSNLSEQHFEWYNVFGCPGLRRSPNYFLIGLAAKLLVSLAFPLILFFAPLVVAMANYKPGANIVKD